VAGKYRPHAFDQLGVLSDSVLFGLTQSVAGITRHRLWDEDERGDFTPVISTGNGTLWLIHCI